MSDYSNQIVYICSRVEHVANKIGKENLQEDFTLSEFIEKIRRFDYTGYYRALQSGQEHIEDIKYYPCCAFSDIVEYIEYPFWDILKRIRFEDCRSLPAIDRVYLDRCKSFLAALSRMAKPQPKNKTLEELFPFGYRQQLESKYQRDLILDIKNALERNLNGKMFSALAYILYKHATIHSRPNTFTDWFATFSLAVGESKTFYKTCKVKKEIEEFEKEFFYILKSRH